MRTPTLAEFKTLARDIAPACRAVLMARIHAEAERARVDAYVRPIFDGYAFAYRGDIADKCGVSGPLPSPKELYLCDDERVAAFYADCDAAHRARGFTGPQGHCPALTAEHLMIQTENALIELVEPTFGVGVHHLHGDDTRARYLDLLISAGVQTDVKERS